jgi:integrase
MSRVTRKLKPIELGRKAKTPGLHGDGGGLYLAVAPAPSTACSWVFRYMINKRARTMGLGSYPEFTLEEAREKAAAARRMKAHGLDPLEVKQAEKVTERVAAAKAMTFKECAAAYIADHRAGWKNPKTGDQWEASLAAYAFPLLGSLPVAAIDTGLVMKVLKGDVLDKDGKPEGPLWTARPETASRVRGRMEVILDWAETNGYREPGKNPARWKGHLDNNLPAKSKVRPVVGHAALPVEDVAAFMASLRERPGLSARALELAILTAARTNEVIGAKWTELDLDKATWIIPRERMKSGREHRVPLSKRAVDILTELQPESGQGPFVFPSGSTDKPLSNMAMLKLLERMGRADLTAHGFRSTFRDWCAESGIARDLAEVCLAHAVTNKAEAAYLRSDVLERRRPVMQSWADYCAGVVADNVKPMRKIDAA